MIIMKTNQEENSIFNYIDNFNPPKRGTFLSWHKSILIEAFELITPKVPSSDRTIISRVLRDDKVHNLGQL